MNVSSVKINYLLECAVAIFQIILTFQRSEYGELVAIDYRQKIIMAFEQFEYQAYQLKLSLLQVQHTKYALAAFVDEVILNSAWEGKLRWMGEPLQLQFFGEHIAGEGFFKRLNELRQNLQQNYDVVEVYAICLQFGFEGIYRSRGREQLIALQTDLHHQIELVGGITDTTLSPDEIDCSNQNSDSDKSISIWLILTIAMLIIFIIYVSFTIAVDHQANSVLQKINEFHDQIQQVVTSAIRQ